MREKHTIAAGIVCAALFMCVAFLHAENDYGQEESSSPVAGAEAADAAPAGTRNSVLSDLNYKIEYLSSRYNEITDEIEKLRAADREQRTLLLEQGLRRDEESKIQGLQLELSVIRAELGQLREDMELLKGKDAAGTTPSQRSWMASPWLPVSSLGVALLALIIAL